MAENKNLVLSEMDYSESSKSFKGRSLDDIPVPILEDLDTRPKTFEEIMAIENGEAEINHEDRTIRLTTRQVGSNVSMTMDQIREELDGKLAAKGFKKIIKVCVFGFICTLLMLVQGNFNLLHCLIVGLASVFILFKVKSFRLLAIFTYLSAMIISVLNIIFVFINGLKTDTESLVRLGMLILIAFIGFGCFFTMFASPEIKKYFEFKEKD